MIKINGAISNFLTANEIPFEKNYELYGYRVDFYLPTLKSLIITSTDYTQNYYERTEYKVLVTYGKTFEEVKLYLTKGDHENIWDSDLLKTPPRVCMPHYKEGERKNKAVHLTLSSFNLEDHFSDRQFDYFVSDSLKLLIMTNSNFDLEYYKRRNYSVVNLMGLSRVEVYDYLNDNKTLKLARMKVKNGLNPKVCHVPDVLIDNPPRPIFLPD